MHYDLLGEDEALRRWGPRLRDDFRIPAADSQHLATAIFNELITLPNLKAQLVDETLSFNVRFNELACFMNFLAERRSYGPISLLENRAHLILSNYVCFVYLGESCFARLRKLAPSGSTSRKCYQFLTDNPVRAFRNAIAHANWSVSEGSITYWARKGDNQDEPLTQSEVSDEELKFWFSLALCVAKSTFAALTYE